MAIESRDLLDLLRRDEKIAWVVDHLLNSFAEGITESAKEKVVNSNPEVDDKTEAREKTKRAKYETTRPYTDSEKIELISFAIQQVFEVIPAMQTAAAHALKEFDVNASVIEFAAPDSEERTDETYSRLLESYGPVERDLRSRYEKFKRALEDDNNN